MRLTVKTGVEHEEAHAGPLEDEPVQIGKLEAVSSDTGIM